MPADPRLQEALRRSRLRRVYGAVGGGMIGSGFAALAVSGLNLVLGKPMLLVWLGLALGLPLTLAGAFFLHRVDA